MFVFFLFFFGLAFGSFINVLALRYEPSEGLITGKTAGGRSRCMSCERTLKWYELLPFFSFVFLRRRCRTCKGPISWQYPVVELVCGFIMAYLPFFFARFFNIGNLFYFKPELWSFYIFVLLWILILLALVLMSAIDFRLYVIPDEINIFVGILGAFLIATKVFGGAWLAFPFGHFIKNYALVFSFSKSIVFGHIFGLAVSGLFFLILYFITRGKGFGFGDVKLAFVLGLLLGYPDTVLSIFFSFILGGVWSLLLLSHGKKTMKSKIPFGPFMALGVIFTVFFGHDALTWYFSLFM